jgi:hypothetical protein
MDSNVRKQLQEVRLRLSSDDQRRLEEVCQRHQIPATLLREMMIVEDDLSQMNRRHGLYDRLSEVLSQYATR